ncbi:MAG: type III-B CRISPR module RAMP protein Cmr6 [Chitinophagales bacterium]
MNKYNSNIGWLFYKAYYKGVDFKAGDKDEGNERHFQKMNEKLFRQQLPTQSLYRYGKDLQVVELKTTYPGLLIGSGYNHGTNKLGEVKIGFYFDHTTGLPLIPGSSVKGLLRSAFPATFYAKVEELRGKPNPKAEDLLKAAQFEKIGGEKLAYIQELLGERGLTFDKEQVVQLEYAIFEGKEARDSEEGKAGYAEISMGNRDVFHDAIVVKSEHPARPDKRVPAGCLMGEDFVTPHKNRSGDGLPDALKNPIPISFIKVLPEVHFRFQFDLKDSGGLDKASKLALFENILRHFGAGSKTNVGYGQFA